MALSYGPILLVAGALGIFCGGWLADSLRKRGYVDAEMRTVVLSALLVWPFAALATVTSSVATSLVLLAPLFFFSSFAFAAAIAALQMVTPSRLRGRVAAVYLLIVNLTGIGLGGTATALVTDYVMHDDRRVGAAMALVAGISAPIAALVLFRGLKYYRAAIAAVAEAGVVEHPVGAVADEITGDGEHARPAGARREAGGVVERDVATIEEVHFFNCGFGLREGGRREGTGHE